ncbi:hypothetical protein Tco_1322633 [Tanacetum coccineum]
MAIDTPPSPYLVVLGDETIDLLLRDDLYTLLMRDREIDFNPCRDIEELECLLVDDPIPIPREFEDSMSSVDHICDSSYVAINDPQFEIVTPPPASKQLSLREVEIFDPFFFLTQSGKKTRVMEIPFFGFHHMPSPRPAAYSPKEVMISFDLEDLRACFQSSNHAVSDHLLPNTRKQEKKRRTYEDYRKYEESHVRIKCGSILKKKKSNYSSFQDMRSSYNRDMVKYKGP